MSGSGTVNKLGGARSGDSMRIPRVDEQEIRNAERLSASFRMTSTGSHDARAYQARVAHEEAAMSQRTADRGTWFEHHNVPPAYRGLSVEGVELGNDSVERVLDALDPDGNGRADEKLLPELVARLTMPVQFEMGALGFKRANLELVNAETVRGLHGGLGQAIEDMQGLANPPRTKVYLAKLRSVMLDGGNGTPGPSSGSGSGKDGERTQNPFESDVARNSQRILRAVVSAGIHPSLLTPGILREASAAEARADRAAIQPMPPAATAQAGAAQIVGTPVRVPGHIPSAAIMANPRYFAAMMTARIVK